MLFEDLDLVFLLIQEALNDNNTTAAKVLLDLSSVRQLDEILFKQVAPAVSSSSQHLTFQQALEATDYSNQEVGNSITIDALRNDNSTSGFILRHILGHPSIQCTGHEYQSPLNLFPAFIDNIYYFPLLRMFISCTKKGIEWPPEEQIQRSDLATHILQSFCLEIFSSVIEAQFPKYPSHIPSSIDHH